MITGTAVPNRPCKSYRYDKQKPFPPRLCYCILFVVFEWFPVEWMKPLWTFQILFPEKRLKHSWSINALGTITILTSWHKIATFKKDQGLLEKKEKRRGIES